MHYIRILRPPTLGAGADGSRGVLQLSLLLTITTDLGESFLCPDEPVELEVVLLKDSPQRSPADGDAASDAAEKCQKGPEEQYFKLIGARGQGPLRWRAGMRVLKANLLLPPALVRDGHIDGSKLCIRTKSPDLAASNMRRIWTLETRGLIMPLFIELRTANPEDTMALRRIEVSDDGEADGLPYVEVEEELGESIARHVWDAGVSTAAMLLALCSRPALPHNAELLLSLWKILLERKELNVLEVGSGVGILGIGLATALDMASFRAPESQASILLTDLTEAQDRASANIARFKRLQKERGLRGETAPIPTTVDYENLDWEDGRVGVFGPKIRSDSWDLIMLSDCTYNVDMLPALVSTLKALCELSVEKGDRTVRSRAGPAILLATKCRHESERELFSLMATAGFTQVELHKSPLPLLGAEQEELEIYLWDKRRCL